jgi:hypothetical protein
VVKISVQLSVTPCIGTRIHMDCHDFLSNVFWFGFVVFFSPVLLSHQIFPFAIIVHIIISADIITASRYHIKFYPNITLLSIRR